MSTTSGGPVDSSSVDRARLDRIFGEVLPETTADERVSEASREGSGDSDEWLRNQVPPHHG